jgi:L,D-peptidoglycan transpeptidase YkuD (ErfK/YbiS/YcfS/YnhG family)
VKPSQSRRQTVKQIVLRSRNPAATQGILRAGNLTLPCVLGRTGRCARKREGDGASPIGAWPIRAIVYRADRLRRPQSAIATRALRVDDGWCDDASDRNYNRPVRHPYRASAEHLWRDDHVYDIIVILGHNDRPRHRGLGSAIFMHIARPELTPTEGCIALTRSHLLRVARLIGPSTRVVI